MKIAGKDTSKYEEMEDRKVLGKFVSQAFRDDRKKSGKSYSSKDEKPPVMNISRKIWNLSIWSDLARQTYIALMDDSIDSTHEHTEQLFFRLVFNFNGGLLEPISDNGENNHKRKKLGTTDTAVNVDQKKKLKVVHKQSMINIEYPKWKQKIEQTLFSEIAAAEALSSLKYMRPEMVFKVEAAHWSHEV